MMKRLWAVLFASVIAISLLLGFQFNAGMVLAAEAEPVSDQDAYVEEVLVKADELGISKAALDLLQEATETVNDRRLLLAYRKLYYLQWKESKVTSTKHNVGGGSTLEYEYNEDGTTRKVKEDQFFEEGGIVFTNYKEETFDKAGNLVEEIWYEGEDPDPFYTSTFEYDDDGRLIRNVAYEYGELSLDVIQGYDEYGNLAYLYEDNNFNYINLEEGNYGYTFQHYDCNNEYDTDGNLIKVTQINRDGSVKKIIGYEYDADGRRIKTTNYKEDGTVSTYVESEYNADGAETKRFTYNPDGSIRSGWEREYDENSLLVKEIKYTADGAFESSSEYTYDENGCEKTCERLFANEEENYTIEMEWVFFPLE